MRQCLPSCLLPVLVALGVTGLAAGQARDQDNIVIVLDASGSMKERMKGANLTRMEAAKQALLQVMNQVKEPEKTNVGLLVFSGRNVPSEWLYPLGPLDRARMEAAIRRPEPNGPTPLGGYIKKGADALLEQRKKQQGYGTYRLLVVTDGEATDGNLVEVYLPDVLARGITVDAIGVDMKSEHSLATRVHSYRRADNPEELAKAVSAVFAEVGSSKDAVADDEAFAILQAIPDDMARSMLTALASSGNHPIGEKPVVQAAPGADTAAPTPTQAAAPPSPAPKSEGGGMAWWFVLLVVLAVGAWWAVRSQQQGRAKR
jgi:uncharacterized protein YegL